MRGKMKEPNSKRQMLLLGLLAVLMVILMIKAPGKFYTLYNFQSMGFQLPELGLISLGMLLVVITGGIDLSICSTASLSGICCAIVLNKCVEMGWPVNVSIGIAIVTGLLISVLCGAFKGFFIAGIGVHPWLVTLGTMSFFPGIGIILTKGGSVSGFPREFYTILGNGTIAGIPVTVIILALVTIILGIALHRTGWGRKLMLVGSGEKVAQFSGISVKGIKFSAYVISSLIAGLGGIIMVSRYNSAKVDHGSSYLMQSIALIVLSGADINGGRADMKAMAITMIIIQFLYTGSSMMGADRYTVVILTGVILIGILLLNTWMDFYTKKKEIIHMQKKESNS